MSDAMNYLNYTSKVLGVKYLASQKKTLNEKVTVVFDKNLAAQEQLVFTKIIEAINLKDFNSQILLPGQDIEEVLESIPSQKVICFLKDNFHHHGVYEKGEQKSLFTHSIEDLTGPNSDKDLLGRKKQTWGLLKSFL